MYKRILDLFFLMLLFEGALRKWEFQGNAEGLVIQAIRDGLPLLALAAYLMAGNSIRLFSQLRPWPRFFFVAYIVICVVSIESMYYQPFVYLVGLRTHFAFMPLLIMMPSYLGSFDQAMKRARWFAIVAAPIFLLAMFQNTQDATSEWNRYAAEVTDIAQFGGGGESGRMVRAAGTFAYISGLQIFGTFMVGFCVCLALGSRRLLDRLLYLGVAVGAAGGILASGSRGGILTVAIQLILILVFGLLNFAMVTPRLIAICIGIAGASPFALNFLYRQLAAFEERTAAIGYEEPARRMQEVILEWIDVGLIHPFGVGLGAGHQTFYSSLIYAQNFWEVDLSRITFEIGYAGVVAYVACKLALSWQIMHGIRRDPSAQSKLLRIFCATTCLLGILNAGLYAPIGNALFWLSAGMGLWCSQMAHMRNRERKAATSLAGLNWTAQAYSRGHPAHLKAWHSRPKS